MVFCLWKSLIYFAFYAKLLQSVSFGKEPSGLQKSQFTGDGCVIQSSLLWVWVKTCEFFIVFGLALAFSDINILKIMLVLFSVLFYFLELKI